MKMLFVMEPFKPLIFNFKMNLAVRHIGPNGRELQASTGRIEPLWAQRHQASG